MTAETLSDAAQSVFAAPTGGRATRFIPGAWRGGARHSLAVQPAETATPRWLNWLWSLVGVTGLSVVLAVAVLAIGLPKVAGAVPLTVLSDSMSPTMPAGSLAVVKPTMPVSAGAPTSLSVEEIEQVNNVSGIEPGDVIVFAPKEGSSITVIHRVITVNTDSAGHRVFTTKGDANDSVDPPVHGYQVRAVAWYRLPWLGYVNSWLDDTTRPMVALTLAVFGFGWAGWNLVRTWALRRVPRRAPATG